MAFLTWSAALAISAFLIWTRMLASSAFSFWAETPRVMALLKRLDREILSRRVHFVTKFVQRVRIVISALGIEHIYLDVSQKR